LSLDELDTFRAVEYRFRAQQTPSLHRTRPIQRSLGTRPRAVIFDMDGLLVDSERTTRQVWQSSTAACGFVLSDDVYLTLIGLGEEEAEAVLASRFGDRFVVPAFREQRVAGMREVMRPAAR
jgi:hypothetical protein